MDNYGFLKVAAATPMVSIADCNQNAKNIISLTQQAAQRGVEIVLFPELAITGYTCGDLFLQSTLLYAAEDALESVVKQTRKLPITIIVGAPIIDGDRVYDCAVVASQGKIMGVVPKRFIPNHGEFAEGRWFSSGIEVASKEIVLCNQEVDFGADITFNVNGVEFGIEISEDLFAATPPSSNLTVEGAKVIFNLSAHTEVVGKYEHIRQTVKQQSARTLSAYVYSAAGFGESSTDLLFCGGSIIAESGVILREGERFSIESQLIVADIDIEKLEMERRSSTTFRADGADSQTTVIEMEVPESLQSSTLDRDINPMPFVPSDITERAIVCEQVVKIQTLALAQRLQKTGCKSVTIGISGGLDSTLALLVAVRTFDLLGLDRKGIIGITMPGFGTSARTYANANILMEELKIEGREISIKEACSQHLKDIGHNPEERSIVYENCQARERTQILMDIANMHGGMVVGTGDMSELALGWATYNGDHMSMYNVNCSVPKTLIQHIVKWIAEHESNNNVSIALLDIVATPVSPELLPADKKGEIAQKTESLVGPYQLHDFFLYNFVKLGYSPSKITYLAELAFANQYDEETIIKWLRLFFSRFFTQQFKRSASPDGPKIGSLSLSPRGGWKMPSEANVNIWLNEIDTL